MQRSQEQKCNTNSANYDRKIPKGTLKNDDTGRNKYLNIVNVVNLQLVHGLAYKESCNQDVTNKPMCRSS